MSTEMDEVFKAEDFAIDQQVFLQFIDESEEILDNAANLFIQIEENPEDIDSLHKLFRIVHTIKGNSPYFNLIHVKNLAHAMEDTMNIIRKEKVVVTSQIINVLMQGIDELKLMFERVRNGLQEIEDQAELSDLINNVRTCLTSASAESTEDIWDKIYASINRLMSSLKNNAEVVQLKNHLNAIKPEKAPEKINDDLPKMILDEIISALDHKNPQPDACSLIKELLQQLREFTAHEKRADIDDAVEVINSVGSQTEISGFLEDYIKEKLADITFVSTPLTEMTEDDNRITEQETNNSKEQVSPDTPESSTKSDKSSSFNEPSQNKTMRISEASLDKFLDFVGELVVVRELFSNLHRQIALTNISGNISSEMKNSLDMFTKLSDSLQKSILEVRKVPIKNILQRAPKLVREIAIAKDKKIKVLISGEEVTIDKSIIETLEGPLVHIVRNSADHGIETPAERLAMNKDETGTIKIDTTEDEDFFYLSVSDDGKGIDTEIIRKKCVEKAIFSKEQAEKLTKGELMNIVFIPGYSSAAEVTEISGRGVGMDVVKKNTEASGGVILIDSEVGKGTKVTLKMPKAVTVRIISGFIVADSKYKFILPLDLVGESFKIESGSIETVSGKGECILRHGRILPIIRLSARIGADTIKSNNQVGITIKDNRQLYVLLVDEVLGIKKVVIKDIVGFEQIKNLIDGGAILGNNEIGLVLNMKGLLS